MFKNTKESIRHSSPGRLRLAAQFRGVVVLLSIIGLLTTVAVASEYANITPRVTEEYQSYQAAITNTTSDAGLLELRSSGKAPSNGGNVNVGERFVLELWVNGGTGASLVGQQSYLTFTYSVLQNVLVSSIGTSCTLTSTLTPDAHVFDATLQNEVCNGPQPCVFRGTKIPIGSIAFASGTLSKPPTKGSFRVAEIGLCAVAPGQARIHWQLSPPEPPQRGTRLVTESNTSVSRNMQFADYVITVVKSSK